MMRLRYFGIGGALPQLRRLLIGLRLRMCFTIASHGLRSPNWRCSIPYHISNNSEISISCSVEIWWAYFSCSGKLNFMHEWQNIVRVVRSTLVASGTDRYFYCQFKSLPDRGASGMGVGNLRKSSQSILRPIMPIFGLNSDRIDWRCGLNTSNIWASWHSL